MHTFPTMLTWVEPRSAQNKWTFLVALKLFIGMFRNAILMSSVVALLLGLAIGNVLYTLKMVAGMWLIISTGYVLWITLMFFIRKYAPKRITVNSDAITVVHTAVREYPLNSVEQLVVSEQQPSIRTLSFLKKVRNTRIKIVIGIDSEIDLNCLRNLLGLEDTINS